MGYILNAPAIFTEPWRIFNYFGPSIPPEHKNSVTADVMIIIDFSQIAASTCRKTGHKTLTRTTATALNRHNGNLNFCGPLGSFLLSKPMNVRVLIRKTDLNSVTGSFNAHQSIAHCLTVPMQKRKPTSACRSRVAAESPYYGYFINGERR